MIKSGANIIDVGGESTRPGSVTVDNKKEWKRIENVIKNFKKRYKKTILSVDTRKSDVMLKSIFYKADIINDVSGFNYDSFSILKLKKKGTGVIYSKIDPSLSFKLRKVIPSLN